FSGASVVGDGGVMLLLDPLSLLEMSAVAALGPEPAIESGGRHALAGATSDDRPCVLLVDDSVSVRKFVGGMLERAGFRVAAARDGADALHAALRRAGFDDVATVTSGAFALTTLERNRPDVIVSRAGVPDIDGYELCAIVRNDPSMTGVLFLLLEGPGDHAPEPRYEDKPDQVLAGDLPLATIVSAVAVLLQRDDATEADEAPVELAQSPAAEVAPAAPAEEPAPPAAFDLMKLAEAMQEIVVGQKTGHLVLT